MKLIHNRMEYQIQFSNNVLNTIVIESPSLLRNFVEQLIEQINGSEGGFVLSKNLSEIAINKNIELFVNPFIDGSHTRAFASRLLAQMQKIAVSETFYQSTIDIQRRLLGFASTLAQDYDGSITFAEEINLNGLMKLLNFTYDFDDCFVENLTTIISATKMFFEKTIFVFINLKSFLETDELIYIFETAKCNECHLLLLENIARSPFIKEEKCCIIDSDLCEIFSEGIYKNDKKTLFSNDFN